VFALPSLWEGMSNALLEAMAAGRAVVATAVDGNVEQVVPDETGLLAPARDADALATALLSLARDPDRARRMGEAGRKRVREKFSLAAMTGAYLALYDELLKE
jgi:glycosyltransferase involved in cell wall biosynthesis